MSARKIYRYSVIPGGVYSPEELARARRIDPIVRFHYADFGQDAHMAQLKADELVYVSYRKQDKVYWTKTKHRVCKGEAVITDGKNQARSRCGNRLSPTPQLPTAKAEPTPNILNGPAVPLPNPGGPTVEASNFGPGDGSPGPGPVASGIGPVPAPTPLARTGAGPGPTPFSTYPSIATFSQGGPLLGPGPIVSGGGGTSTNTGGTTTGPSGGGLGGGTTGTAPGGPGVTAVPEPASLFLLLLALPAISRRRQQS